MIQQLDCLLDTNKSLLKPNHPEKAQFFGFDNRFGTGSGYCPILGPICCAWYWHWI